MELFSINERELIKNRIIEIAKENENILSFVLVGSGAVGFLDDISDIDSYIIIDSKENLPTVMKYMKEHIEKNIGLLFFEQIDGRRLQICLLNNYLEIDIGYSPIDEAEADMERFKVMFDKTNTVNYLMDETWQKNKEIQQAKIFNTDFHDKLNHYAGDIWHFLFHAAVAIKRGQYWRCIAEMEIARNRIIEIKGQKYSLETKRFRDVDKFPQVDLENIQKTLAAEFSQEALLQNLLHLTDLIYDEFESHLHDKIAVKRQNVIEYISNVIR